MMGKNFHGCNCFILLFVCFINAQVFLNNTNGNERSFKYFKRDNGIDEILSGDVFANSESPRDTIPASNVTFPEYVNRFRVEADNNTVSNFQTAYINSTGDFNTSRNEVTAKVYNEIENANASLLPLANTSNFSPEVNASIIVPFTNTSNLLQKGNISDNASERDIISSNINGDSSRNTTSDFFSVPPLNNNESSQDKSSINWNNEPIISDPIPIRNFVADNKPLVTLPLDDLLTENTVKPVTVELTRYKNESSLVLNSTNNMNTSINETENSLPSFPNKTSNELDTSFYESSAPVIGPDVLSALSTNLQQDVLDLWPYRDYIKGPEDLMLDQGLINRAKLNTGPGKRLRRIFERGVRGQNVHVALISSSVSRAFLKDPTSKRWLYPNALVNWWAKVVSPITRSQMILRDVSISGIGSDYFSRCLKSHLQDDGETDMILWELSGSDYKPGGVLKPTDAEAFEQFLRNVLEYKSNPEVVLLNFFRGNHFNKTAYCRELDESKEARLAKYYDCTALSWSKSICPYLKDDEEGFSYSYLFSRDQTHPSIIGHAQMAYILIDYLRDEFLKFLDENKSAKHFSRSVIMPLPRSLFAQQDVSTLCYTTLKAVDDPPDAEGSDLPVIFIAPEPFEDAAHRSHIAKYIYRPSMKMLIMRMTIPGARTSFMKRTIAIMPYFTSPAKTMVRVDNQPFRELKISNYNRGKILKLEPSLLLSGGDHMLRIWSLDKQFKILALTVDQ